MAENVESIAAHSFSGQTVAGLMQKVNEAEKAAAEWGVRPDHPEGYFIATLLTAIRSIGSVIVAVEKDAAGRDEALTRNLATVERLGAMQIAKAEELVKAGAIAMKLGEQALRSADVEYDKAIMRHMHALKPLIVEEIKKWTVLKERERSFQTRAKWAVAASLLTMIVAGSGYAYREWEDKNAAAVLDACSRRMVVAENGHHVCSVEFP